MTIPETGSLGAQNFLQSERNRSENRSGGLHPGLILSDILSTHAVSILGVFLSQLRPNAVSIAGFLV